MDPHRNEFRAIDDENRLDDGTALPPHWSTFTVGEEIEIRGYRYRVDDIEVGAMRLVPVGPVKKARVSGNAKNWRRRRKRRQR